MPSGEVNNIGYEVCGGQGNKELGEPMEGMYRGSQTSLLEYSAMAMETSQVTVSGLPCLGQRSILGDLMEILFVPICYFVDRLTLFQSVCTGKSARA